MLRATVIAASLVAVCTLLSAVAPAVADNAVSTTPTDFVTAGGSECGNGETLDDLAAAEARQRVEAVGYTDVQILERGCDNFWRATGVKGGERRELTITPDGGVLPGGN